MSQLILLLILLAATVSVAWFSINSLHGPAVAFNPLTQKLESRMQIQPARPLAKGFPWIWDLKEARYCFVGAEAEVLLGYPMEHWHGFELWRGVLHPDDFRLVEDSIMKAIWAEFRTSYRHRVLHRNGRVVSVESNVTVILEDGEPHYVCGLTRVLS